MFEGPRGWWRRGVRAPLRRLRAALYMLRGRVGAAERELRLASRDAPRSFGVHASWGRALLASGREEDAKDAFRRCYLLSAARFLDEDLPARLREQVAIECELPPPVFARRRAGPPPEREASFRGPSDFADDAERRRFQSMGPLGKTNPADVDWDALIEQLSRPQHPGETRGS